VGALVNPKSFLDRVGICICRSYLYASEIATHGS
jgi:hypothetical protein